MYTTPISMYFSHLLVESSDGTACWLIMPLGADVSVWIKLLRWRFYPDKDEHSFQVWFQTGASTFLDFSVKFESNVQLLYWPLCQKVRMSNKQVNAVTASIASSDIHCFCLPMIDTWKTYTSLTSLFFLCFIPAPLILLPLSTHHSFTINAHVLHWRAQAWKAGEKNLPVSIQGASLPFELKAVKLYHIGMGVLPNPFEIYSRGSPLVHRVTS